MRSYVPSYRLQVARNLKEAQTLFEDGFRPIAGGTDVMALLATGELPHRKWVSIRRLTELRGIDISVEHVTIGALTTFTDVRRHSLIAAEFPMLSDAAARAGGIAIQNRGTIGGNIVNASPAADTPPPLLAYDAEIEITWPRGARWIPYAQFHKGLGRVELAGDELVTRVRVPRRFAGYRQFYRKVSGRRAPAISKICFAGVRLGEDMRIGLGGVADTPLLITTESTGGIAPADDLRSTARYRAQVLKNLYEEFLRDAE